MKIQKMNVVKDIPDKAFPEYERMGYSKLDASGKMIKSKSKEASEKMAALESDVAEKNREIDKLNKDLDAADDRIAKLEAELGRQGK